MNKVAIGRIVLATREHMIELEPMDDAWSARCFGTRMRCAQSGSISTKSST